MPSLSKLRPMFRRTDADAAIATAETIEVTEHINAGEVEGRRDEIAQWKAHQPNEDAQRGILDIWGRAEGFALMIALATLGLVLMACANTLAIFCAAQVFSSIGFAGVIYSIDVITSDAFHLRN
ncbi:MFS siderochrome iron transporter MirB [Paraphaeosphaeria sporulosa]